jgi:methionine synthase II (cobalamin-independent)
LDSVTNSISSRVGSRDCRHELVDLARSAASPQELRRRIDEAARYVPIDQLCLSPQCGFSSTVEGNALTYDEQVAKLQLVVDTVRAIWG